MNQENKARHEYKPRNCLKFSIAALVAGFIFITFAFFFDVFGTALSVSFYEFQNSQVQALEESYRIRSEMYHHDLKANVDIPNATWGKIKYRVSTNSLGFKDSSPRQIELISDKKRILFIGDSFTEGLGMPYEDTFVGLVGSALREKDIEVLNAAVTSYYPGIYLEKIKYLLEQVHLKLDEVYVFIDISDINDEALYANVGMQALRGFNDQSEPANSAIVKSLKQGAGPIDRFCLFARNFIQKHTRVTKALTSDVDFFSSLFPTHYPQSELNQLRSLWTLSDAHFNVYGKIGLQLAKHHMTELAGMLKKKNIGLTVAVYPWPIQILQKDLNSRQVLEWSQWANENGSRFLNLFPYFINEVTPEVMLSKYFIPGDVHWNAAGHKIVANQVLKAFE